MHVVVRSEWADVAALLKERVKLAACMLLAANVSILVLHLLMSFNKQCESSSIVKSSESWIQANKYTYSRIADRKLSSIYYI